MKLTQKQLDKVSASILTNFLACAYLEQLKDLPIYKHNLKGLINKTTEELIKVEEKYYDNIFDKATPELSDKLTANLQWLVNAITKDKGLLELSDFTQIINAYSEQPRKVMGIVHKINKELIKD